MTNAGAALGARTARACDGCMRRRARWHCAADDAYLCQACDASVHSANPLARRHHRVRLSSSASSSSSSPAAASSQHAAGPDAPAWLHGLRRRPRTPRRKPGGVNGSKQQHDALGTKAASVPVPDLEADDESLSGIILGAGNEVDQLADEDDDLLYQVPVLDPMLAELYSHPMPADDDQKPCCFAPLVVTEPSSSAGYGGVSGLADGDGFSGFDLVPDMELASFAADMESLLMGAVDSGYDDLGFLDDKKPQMSHHLGFDDMQDDFESTVAPAPQEQQHQEDRKRKRPDQMILKLDYDGVISSWTHHGASPWFYGERPHLDPSSDSWLDFPAGSGRGFGLGAAVTAVTGGEREARVSRYREKRRTRLFAKKIRYEVRKLNAEKRPRMKGRFVKRAALPPLPPRATPMMLAAPHGGSAHGRYRL